VAGAVRVEVMRAGAMGAARAVVVLVAQ